MFCGGWMSVRGSVQFRSVARWPTLQTSRKRGLRRAATLVRALSCHMAGNDQRSYIWLWEFSRERQRCVGEKFPFKMLQLNLIAPQLPSFSLRWSSCHAARVLVRGKKRGGGQSKRGLESDRMVDIMSLYNKGWCCWQRGSWAGKKWKEEMQTRR